MFRPDVVKRVDIETDMERQFAILHKKEAGFTELARALFTILEKSSNEEDCFWISHAWAESLIHGVTRSKNLFPSLPVQIRFEGAWRPDSRGVHVSFGATAYEVTEGTKGREKKFAPREYKDLIEVNTVGDLFQFLINLPDGGLAMILMGEHSSRGRHAVLATRLNGHVIIINSSSEPGAWIESWQEFAAEEKDTRGYNIYRYPEKIHSFG